MRAATQQQQQLLPFRPNTRQRFAPVGTAGYTADGARLSFELPRVGYLSHLLVQLRARVNIPTGGATVASLGPWNLIRRLTFRINVGSAVLYSASGWSTWLLGRRRRRYFDSVNLSSVPTAQGNDQQLTLTYLVPIATNYGDNFHLGLVNLQAPELQANLDVEIGSLVGDAYTTSGVAYNTSTTQPAVEVGYMFYEVPDPRRVLQPPLVLHRCLESSISLTGAAAGSTVTHQWSREGIVQGVTYTLLGNNGRTDAWDRVALRANRTDEIYRMERWQVKAWELYYYGEVMPTGVLGWEFFAASGNGDPGEGDSRDFVNSEVISTLETLITLGSGFTSGANAQLIELREFTQILSLG